MARGARASLARRRCAGATLDLSGPYRAVFDEMLPDATQVADPFHVVKLANSKLDECRRRVQNETMGHRGRKHDPLYRCRRLLTKADERLDDNGREKLLGLLARRRPQGRGDHGLAREGSRPRALRPHRRRRSPASGSSGSPSTWPTRTTRSRSARSAGRSKRWKQQIAAWHRAQVSNGPTEAVEQPDQAGEARRLRLHELPQLPDPVTALRRQAQLGAARDDHTPLKSEAPAIRRTSSRRMDRNRVAYPTLRSPGRRPPDARQHY